jgi:hypothetical protein
MPNSWNLTSRNFSKKSNIEHKSQPVDVDGSCSKILFNPNRSEVKSSSFQSNRSALSAHIQRAAVLQTKPVVFSLKRTADTLLPHRTSDHDLPVARPNKILRTNSVIKIGATHDIVESSDRKTFPALQCNLKRKS